MARGKPPPLADRAPCGGTVNPPGCCGRTNGGAEAPLVAVQSGAYLPILKYAEYIDVKPSSSETLILQQLPTVLSRKSAL